MCYEPANVVQNMKLLHISIDLMVTIRLKSNYDNHSHTLKKLSLKYQISMVDYQRIILI